MLQATHESAAPPPSLTTSTIKICGLCTADALEVALAAGADMVGFVHFPRSPRHLGLGAGRELSALARGRALRVLLLVDPDDETLDEALAALGPDLVQLHGSETPERVAAIRTRTGIPVMKAIGIAHEADLDRIGLYRGAANRILVDAKPPPGAEIPGGNGVAFDWSLLSSGLELGPDLMLSGGLTPENVARAVALTGIGAVDVSSGVETRPGEKDAGKIAAFIGAARAAAATASSRTVSR